MFPGEVASKLYAYVVYAGYTYKRTDVESFRINREEKYKHEESKDVYVNVTSYGIQD